MLSQINYCAVVEHRKFTEKGVNTVQSRARVIRSLFVQDWCVQSQLLYQWSA